MLPAAEAENLHRRPAEYRRRYPRLSTGVARLVQVDQQHSVEVHPVAAPSDSIRSRRGAVPTCALADASSVKFNDPVSSVRYSRTSPAYAIAR